MKYVVVGVLRLSITRNRSRAKQPLATQGITEIWEYIAADNPLAARRVREELYNAIHALVPLPNQGHRRPDLTSRPLRFIAVGEYLIAYAPDEKPLRVVAVMHQSSSAKTDLSIYVLAWLFAPEPQLLCRADGAHR